MYYTIMKILNLFRKRKLLGTGVIKLKTYLEDDHYITYCKKKFGRLSVEGVIGELEKIIKELKKR